jgi:hypothetical protein
MGYFFKNSEVSLQVPTQYMVEDLLNHFNDLKDFDMEPSLTDFNEFTALGLFSHPVWWVNPYSCASDYFSECFCGRVSLVDVMLNLEDSTSREHAYTQHKSAMSLAFNHYWSGDSLSGGNLFDVCPSCIALGADHISIVGFEAQQLALELGEALAAFNDDFSNKF